MSSQQQSKMIKANSLKKKLKRQDFIFEDGWFEELYRKPGQLHMQQFQLSDCQQCTIALFDASACVYVDQCKYCWIFIGPSESSVFIRDCIGLTIICAARQFRVRDSSHCKIALYCQSQPIIQSSHDLRFDCFPDWGYTQMPQQFQKCKMSPWNNHWYDIYDFTPKMDSFSLKKLDSDDLHPKKYLSALKLNGMNPETQMIPRCLGKMEQTVKDFNVLVFKEVPKSTAGPSFLESRISPMPDALFPQFKDSVEERKVLLFLKIFKEAKSYWKNIKGIARVVQDQQTLKAMQENVFVPFRDEH